MRSYITLVEAMLAEKVGMHDGDEYFTLDDIAAVHNPKSRATLVYMSPTEFLDMAQEGHDPDKARGVLDLVKRGIKFKSTPMLFITHNNKGLATVAAHEGRHRARLLQALGVKSMPVVLNSASDNHGPAIRWGSQDNPIDKIAVMPTQLRGQDGRTVMPMPRSVIFP